MATPELTRLPSALAVPGASSGTRSELRLMRLVLTLYIALWIFEGALRKWILPGLSNPLLIIRDPVLLLLYVLAVMKGVFPTRAVVGWIIGLGAFAFALSFVSTNVPLFIQLYGLRADYFHLPLIFLVPMIFDRDDVRRVGKWILLIGGPMAVLVLLQFRSPGGGFLNRGAGGGEGGMLESAYGHIRPSGTYSFTNGLTGFTSLVVAFFLHHLLEQKVYPRLLWLATGPALVVLITLSGSRVAVGLAGLIMTSVIFICFVKARYWQPALKLIMVGAVAFVAVGSFAVFRSGLEVFAYRFGDADNVRTGFFGRFVDTIVGPYYLLEDVPASGVGLGMGTNVAGALITGKRAFLVAEGEWPRVLMESGAYIGSAFILLRGAIVLCLAAAALRSLRQSANTLPVLIFAGCFVDLLQGQFAQPTALGFAVIAGSLCLAACNVPKSMVEVTPTTLPPSALAPGRSERSRLMHAVPSAPPPGVPSVPEPAVAKEAPAAPVPGRRGRSIYADRLHGSEGE